MELIRPYAIKPGDTIGVFTPSSPAYQVNEELFSNGIRNLEQLGYRVKLGRLTQSRNTQGYRSGSPQERAQEFMDLIMDDEVHALMSTIGGSNSSSMIPYLDFDLIRQKRKIMCGYSDVTSLHMSILKYAGLKTIYGPAVMTWFGEYPNGIQESIDSFVQAVTFHNAPKRKVVPFARWSNHQRDWTNGDWKNIERQWNENPGWKVLQEGHSTAELVVANLNTLVSAAGTSYFPDLQNKILLIEEMAAPFDRLERNLTQLKLIGVFDQICGLIMGKSEMPNTKGAPFSLDDLLLEVVGRQEYAIISNFDCSHTVPMHSLGQRCTIDLKAQNQWDVTCVLLDSFVEA